MTPVRWLFWLLCAALALTLAGLILQRNLARSCELREWPKFSFCPTPDAAIDAQVRDLRVRIAANPGDSGAWLALALLTSQPEGVSPLDDGAVLAVASRLAPQDPMLLQVQADRFLRTEQWDAAVKVLVRLVQEQRDTDAARALARLTANPAAHAALHAALKPGSTWLEPVLGQLATAGVPLTQAMPLVATALPLNLISPRSGQAMMRALKGDGQWLEAQALWVYLLGGKAALLYNGGFETGFVGDGFDWEVRSAAHSKSGVLVEQPQLGARGRVLQLEFNGRPMALPLVRQVLVLPPGSYGFSGEYMGRHMRTEQGLAWVFKCVAGGSELGRTPPLLDTRGEWRRMEIAVSVPAECGAVNLELNTQLGSEAMSGMRGQMNFDDFRLVVR